MVCAGQVPEEQLMRQRKWLGDSWTWLLRTMVLDQQAAGRRPTALDVGCGPGLVMELLSPHLDVQGIDIDPQAVAASNRRGMRASLAAAEQLPFDDGSFDIVYCSYLLLWVKDPEQVLREMIRASRKWIICLAEPDHRGRISYPDDLAALDRRFIGSLQEEGADPGMGRKLPELFARCGLRPLAGVHANMWSIGRISQDAEAEWQALTSSIDRGSLSGARKAWDQAVAAGSLVQYNPVFYALATKPGQERAEQE